MSRDSLNDVGHLQQQCKLQSKRGSIVPSFHVFASSVLTASDKTGAETVLVGIFAVAYVGRYQVPRQFRWSAFRFLTFFSTWPATDILNADPEN